MQLTGGETTVHVGIKSYYNSDEILFKRRWNGTEIPDGHPFFAIGEPGYEIDKQCSILVANPTLSVYDGLRDLICTLKRPFLCERKIKDY